VDIGVGVRLGRGVEVRAAPGARVQIGSGCEIGSRTSLTAEAHGELVLEENVFVSGGCIVAARAQVRIGTDSMLAEMVCVRDHDHDPDHPPRSGRTLSQPVLIGERVWLGSKSSVVRGGSVGSDSVVGAHALVNRPIPPRSVAVGVPARVVRGRRPASGGA